MFASFFLLSGVREVRWDRVYGTNLDQVGPNMAKLDQLGQVGRNFAVFCLLRKAPLTNLDQVGPVLFPTIFRALLILAIGVVLFTIGVFCLQLEPFCMRWKVWL